jgi:O-methyltransferase involved in polyketide biosynthesis
MYLTEEAIFETLRAVASLASESEMLFDYPLPESLVDAENKQFLVALKAFGAAVSLDESSGRSLTLAFFQERGAR